MDQIKFSACVNILSSSYWNAGIMPQEKNARHQKNQNKTQKNYPNTSTFSTPWLSLLVCIFIKQDLCNNENNLFAFERKRIWNSPMNCRIN